MVPMIRRMIPTIPRARRGISAATLPIVAGLLPIVAACGPGEDMPAEDATDAEPAMTATPMEHDNDIIVLLDSGQPVFGMFAPEKSAEGGEQAAANTETDFIFYSLESGPWDIPTLETFMASMSEASGGEPHPVVLRIPPVRDDREAARTHLAEGLAAGVDGLVLPHVESVEDVALATEAVGDRLWPVSAEGDVPASASRFRGPVTSGGPTTATWRPWRTPSRPSWPPVWSSTSRAASPPDPTTSPSGLTRASR
jgi:hypothetical protein